MAPRAKGAGTHRDFDIGVAGRRTGVAAPSNVRRNSEDFEDFDGYYGASSPNKKASTAATPRRYAGGGAASSSVGRRSATSAAGAPMSAGRAKANRPDLYHEIGERGRKTGIKVPKNVARDSNDFERFDEFLSSLSPDPPNRTARQSAATRLSSSANRRPVPQPQYEEEEEEDEEEEDTTGTRRDDDDDGTRAMSLVDGDTGPSPETYLSKARASQGRPSLTDLNSTRTYDDADMVDYDMPFSPPVISPAPQSPGQGRKRLSEASADDEDGDVSAMSKRRKSTRSSLGTPTSAKSKGKARAVSEEVVEQQDEEEEEEPQDVEEVEEIEVVHEGYPSDFDDNPDDTFANAVNGHGAASRAQLPDIMEEEEEEEDDEDEELSVPRVKAAPKPRKQYARDDPPGVRRSKRERIAPLEFWRNEKVVYRRRISSGQHGGVRGVPVVTMADVVRKPSEKPEPFAAKWKRYGSARPASVAPASHRRHKSEGTAAPEDGMDTNTRPEGVVWSWEKNDETTRRVAFTSQMVETRPHLLMRGRTANGDVDEDEPPFVFQKVFTELDYMAGGLLTIPVGKGKPMKPSKDNSYMFYVLEGAVTVTVHRTSFVVAPNGMFMVPRGNLYGIENAGERNARLFFVQARRTPLDEATLAQAQEASFLQQAEEEAPEEQEEEEEESEEEEAPPPKKKKKGRPSKAKPPSKPIADSSDEDIIRQRKKKQPASVKRR